MFIFRVILCYLPLILIALIIMLRISIYNYYWITNTQDVLKADIIINSVTYFSTSKIYPNNTALILMTAHYQLSHKRKFKCFSIDINGETKTSIATFKSAYQNVGPCLMHTFIASCSTIPSPKELYVTAPHKSDLIQLPLRYGVAEKLPIVSCVSSLYFAERWQIIAMSIEWYSYFGINRQAYYLISAMEGIYELLKVYEKLKIIDIHPWNIPNIHELNSRKELDSRDIAGTLNDCYINYREAADFIIVHDVDDLIYLKSSPLFYPAFQQHWQKFPLTKSLNLTARTVEMEAEKGFENFSILKTFQSMNALPKRIFGKSVYNTSLIESVWIHWPTEFDKRLKSMTWEESDAILIHARNFYFGKYNQTTMIKNFVKEQLLEDHHARAIHENFETRKTFFSNNKLIQKLESSMRYYETIDKCTLRMGGKGAKNYGCRTHYACKIPRFNGIHCIESRQKFIKHILTPLLTFYVPAKPAIPTLNKNGCSF